MVMFILGLGMSVHNPTLFTVAICSPLDCNPLGQKHFLLHHCCLCRAPSHSADQLPSVSALLRGAHGAPQVVKQHLTVNSHVK